MPRYSTDESSRVCTYGGLLPNSGSASISPSTLPRFHWPSEQHLVPTDCQRNHCGGSLWINIPTADQRVTDVTCSLCTRVACELISDNAPARKDATL